jgi:hypothetical protein
LFARRDFRRFWFSKNSNQQNEKKLRMSEKFIFQLQWIHSLYNINFFEVKNKRFQ